MMPAVELLQALQRDSLPAGPPISGPLWSVVVPALLLAFAAGATYLLYRRFAARTS